jgi:ligand-binding sensor domain-containing protein
MFFHLGLVILAVLFALSARAQSLIHYNYSVEHGLPSSEAYDVLQDSKGYIWIATDRGVSRYDGYSFESFTTENGLTDNTVFQMYEDNRGRIWFLTFNSQLCYLQNDSIRLYRYNDVLAAIPPKSKIVRSFSCSGDTVTIGYLFSGLIRILPDGKSIRLSPSQEAHIFYSMDSGQSIALSSYSVYPRPLVEKDMFYFQSGDNRIAINLPPHPGVRVNIAGIRRRNGRRVIYCPGILIEIDADLSYRTVLLSREVYRVYEDSDSCLWISYAKGGVHRYRPNESLTSNAFSTCFPGESISAICEDSEKGFWFSSLDKGLFFVPTLAVAMMDSIASDAINVCSDGKGNYLLAYKNGELDLLQETGGRFSHKHVENSNTANNCALYEPQSGRFWVGGNLNTLMIKDGRPEVVYSSASTSLAIDTANRCIWAWTTLQLSQRDLRRPQHIINQFPILFRGNDLYAASRGRLWMGAIDGLYLFENGKATHQEDKDSLLYSRIVDIEEMHPGLLVIATIGSGILIKENGKVRQISMKDGMCSNVVNGIALEGNVIWAATNKGLSRVELTEAKLFITNYDVYNGLPTNELRRVHPEKGYLWIATSKGVIRIDKKEIDANRTPPRIYIDKIFVNDSTAHAAPGTLMLDYDHDLLRIAFKGLSFKRKGNINYKYILRGLTEVWQYTHTPLVQFTSLDPGDYVFEVYAQNENGIWSSLPARLSISVKPPYWSTWWFLSLLSIAGISVLCLGVSLRLRQQRNKTRMMEMINGLRLQALASQMNPHFLFNTLNSVQAYILVEDKESAAKYLSRFSRLMRLELENIRSEFVPVEKELELLKYYLELEQLRFKNLFEYEMQVDGSVKSSKMLIPSMLIQPYIENSIKHGLQPLQGRKGKLVVTIYKRDDLLYCSVEDNGVGRKAAVKNKSIGHRSAGMDVTAQRIKLLCKTLNQNYSVQVIDKSDKDGSPTGTVVEFTLPYKYERQAKDDNR